MGICMNGLISMSIQYEREIRFYRILSTDFIQSFNDIANFIHIYKILKLKVHYSTVAHYLRYYLRHYMLISFVSIALNGMPSIENKSKAIHELKLNGQTNENAYRELDATNNNNNN